MMSNQTRFSRVLYCTSKVAGQKQFSPWKIGHNLFYDVDKSACAASKIFSPFLELFDITVDPKFGIPIQYSLLPPVCSESFN